MLVKFLFIFAITWWVVIFMVLPFGINVPKKQIKGNADSAPDNPRLLLKAVITTVISLIITYLVVLGLDSGLISIENM